MGRTISDMFEWIVASGISGFLMLAMVYGESLEEPLVEMFKCVVLNSMMMFQFPHSIYMYIYIYIYIYI